MPWIKLDDGFPDHPKVLAAGPLAAWLYVCGIAYAARYLTDGFVPAAQVARLADVKHSDRLASQLVQAGLWEIVEGGYQIHDYLDYQDPSSKVQAKRDEARERMRRLRSGPQPARGSQDVRANIPRSSQKVSDLTPQPYIDTPPEDVNSPPPLSLPNGAAPPPASESARLFSVYCDLTTVDQSEVPKATSNRQVGIFAELLTRFQPADIEGCMNWLRTWRQVPWKPESLRKEIDGWIVTGRPKEGVTEITGPASKAKTSAVRPHSVVSTVPSREQFRQDAEAMRNGTTRGRGS